MRKPMVIGLVLLGGGISSAGILADIRHQRRCDAARADNRPDADAVCARTPSNAGGSGSHTSWISRAGLSDGSGGGSAVSARGGFGGFGHGAG